MSIWEFYQLGCIHPPVAVGQAILYIDMIDTCQIYLQNNGFKAHMYIAYPKRHRSFTLKHCLDILCRISIIWAFFTSGFPFTHKIFIFPTL